MIEQPKLCDECIEYVRSDAAKASDGEWLGFYCPHNSALSFHQSQGGKIARMQLTGPLTWDEAHKHSEHVKAGMKQ